MLPREGVAELAGAGVAVAAPGCDEAVEQPHEDDVGRVSWPGFGLGQAVSPPLDGLVDESDPLVSKAPGHEDGPALAPEDVAECDGRFGEVSEPALAGGGLGCEDSLEAEEDADDGEDGPKLDRDEPLGCGDSFGEADWVLLDADDPAGEDDSLGWDDFEEGDCAEAEPELGCVEDSGQPQGVPAEEADSVVFAPAPVPDRSLEPAGDAPVLPPGASDGEEDRPGEVPESCVAP